MDFRILGPLEVRDEGREVRLRGGKERALLALLLLNANRTLALERIVDELWGEDAPETAQKMVQVYVSRLRKALPADMLRTRPPGYALVLDEKQIDLHRFEMAVADGAYSDALALWRGPALAEFATEPFARAEGARLEDLRVDALEARLEAELALGRHRAAAGELEALIAQHPLRERLRSLHMLALYRSGRHAEALASYQTFRRRLSDELGIEPSAALRELERQMLQQDPALDRESYGAPGVGDVAYARSGGTRIAYQVVGDGPLDLVLVHGWICTFQPGWEYPPLAAFYRRLASMGRLILFDKRGTGLSDRVEPDHLPDLETRMDDVRAVLDAVGSRRAVLIGISEGGAMCTLFAAMHPDRSVALVLMGSFAREMRAPDYPAGVSEEDFRRRLALLEQDDWASAAVADWLGRVAPAKLRDDAARRWYTSYLQRGVSPGAARALRLMNLGIDVRELLPSISVPALVMHRARETWNEGSRYLGERIPGARIAELPGEDHLPWEGDAPALLDELERFLAGAQEEVEPDRVLVALLHLDAVAADARLRAELTRHRGREVEDPGNGVLARFDGPARAIRCGLALAAADVRAGVHTGEVEQVNGAVRGAAVDVVRQISAQAMPGEVLVSSTVKDIVAGSGIEFDDRGDRLFAARR